MPFSPAKQPIMLPSVVVANKWLGHIHTETSRGPLLEAGTDYDGIVLHDIDISSGLLLGHFVVITSHPNSVHRQSIT